MVDKGIQPLRGAKQHFNQHAVIASHAVALHNIAAALDGGVKLRLELGVHIQVDELGAFYSVFVRIRKINGFLIKRGHS